MALKIQIGELTQIHVDLDKLPVALILELEIVLRGAFNLFNTILIFIQSRYNCQIMQKNISINHAKVDMILAEAISDSHGIILAPAGSKLTQKLIPILKKHNCQNIKIESKTKLSQSQYDSLVQSLNKRFKPIEKNNPLQHIYENIVSKYLI